MTLTAAPKFSDRHIQARLALKFAEALKAQSEAILADESVRTARIENPLLPAHLQGYAPRELAKYIETIENLATNEEAGRKCIVCDRVFPIDDMTSLEDRADSYICVECDRWKR